MERSVFARRLATASELCCEFTSTMILEDLFDSYRYFAELNCSHDGNVKPEDNVVLYPDDTEVYGDRVGPIDSEGVVSLLWREERVPEWIDIFVWGIYDRTTYFKLLCCGRYNDNENKLYYRWNSSNDEPLAPFGIKVFPIPRRCWKSWEEDGPGERYSILEASPDFPYR